MSDETPDEAFKRATKAMDYASQRLCEARLSLTNAHKQLAAAQNEHERAIEDAETCMMNIQRAAMALGLTYIDVISGNATASGEVRT